MELSRLGERHLLCVEVPEAPCRRGDRVAVRCRYPGGAGTLRLSGQVVAAVPLPRGGKCLTVDARAADSVWTLHELGPAAPVVTLL